MARTVAELPPGTRITDYISLGVISKAFPDSAIGAVLARTGKASLRHRDLPAQVAVYYVLALALYMQSSYCAVCWKECSGVEGSTMRARSTMRTSVVRLRLIATNSELLSAVHSRAGACLGILQTGLIQ